MHTYIYTLYRYYVPYTYYHTFSIHVGTDFQMGEQMYWMILKKSK